MDGGKELDIPMQHDTTTTGLTMTQLEQLCQKGQLENTLHLLFYLNHWAKNRERLFFADRQGLYQVKAALLKQAYVIGAIEAVAYVDGTQEFGNDLMLDAAADITAEVITERLDELSDSTYFTSRLRSEYDQVVCQFYARMTGKTIASSEDIDEVETVQVREYLYERLIELEREARVARQPVPCGELAALCIAPGDIIYIQGSHFSHLANWDSWDDLDASDLRKLDPEGLSLIAFRYTSAAVRYVFHLPFRLAEAFLPEQLVRELKSMPTTSREAGEYYGRAITEAESLHYPIGEILQKLGVDVAAICPHQLSSKQEYVLAKARVYAWRNEEEYYDDDDDEWDEEDWLDVYLPAKRKKRSRRKKVSREQACCPVCSVQIHLAEISRIEHWRRAHTWLDLTFSQASWVMNSTTSKNQFCREFPPDYRVLDEKEHGTRYWKLETLEGWVKERPVQETE